MDKTWSHLFNATSVVLTLLLGEQLDVVSSCSHARLSASPASVYLLVKLINWFGTWLACAARPKGLVSGVLIRWGPGSGFASIHSQALCESAGENRGGAAEACVHWQGLSASREGGVLRTHQSLVVLCLS